MISAHQIATNPTGMPTSMKRTEKKSTWFVVIPKYSVVGPGIGANASQPIAFPPADLIDQ